MAEEAKPESKTETKTETKTEEVKREPVPYERFAAENARRHKAETELETLRKAQAERDENALKDQKKFEELYGKAKPRAELADELEASVKDYLDSELSDLSDEHKALIPEGAPHKQLAWVKKAKAAGVFGKQNPPKTFDGKAKSGVQPDKWYLELKAEDPRLAKLSSPQYLEWKAHNNPAPKIVAGGF